MFYPVIMIKSIGVDIEDVKDFKKIIKDNKIINNLFTKREINYCNKKKEPWISFTGKFCAKEALIKAYKKNIEIKNIEILNKKNSKLAVLINGKEMKNIKCSIAHTKDKAIAFVIIC